MAFGHSSMHVYYCAATIYGFASSFDESFREKAAHFVELALLHGMPTSAVRLTPSLAIYLETPAFADKFAANKVARNDSCADHFLNPLE